MVKGVSITFKSYAESVPRLLQVTKFENLLKQHNLIILKPCLNSSGNNTSADFVEQVLKYCIAHKNQDSKIIIAEGSDGEDTKELFNKSGYNRLSEEYSVGLVDLNTADVQEIRDGKFTVFDTIMYPSVLTSGLIISLPKLGAHSEFEMSGALANMLGAFPSKYYKGFFSSSKSKLRQEPIKYSIHDILRCKMPQAAVIDASESGLLFTGDPLEIDKQAAKLLKGDWKSVAHLRLIEDSFAPDFEMQAKKAEKQAKEQKQQ